MRVKFTQALRFGEKVFGLGVFDIPDSILDDPKHAADIEKYATIGWIVDPTDSDQKPESLAERNKRVAAKILADDKAMRVSFETDKAPSTEKLSVANEELVAEESKDAQAPTQKSDKSKGNKNKG